MTKQELYELAKQLTDKEVVYLLCSHLEHIGKAELGGHIDAGNIQYDVVVKASLK